MNIQLPPKFSEQVWSELRKWGLFAVLFVGLLAYVLQTNQARELRYISVIDKMAPALQQMQADVKDVKDDVSDIKAEIERSK